MTWANVAYHAVWPTAIVLVAWIVWHYDYKTDKAKADSEYLDVPEDDNETVTNGRLAGGVGEPRPVSEGSKGGAKFTCEP